MRAVFLLILSCLSFSILAALIKFLSSQVHPFEQAFFRNIISLLFILPFVLRQKFLVKNKQNIKLLILRGLFGGITMILLFWSYTLIPLSQAMAISFTTPLFMYLGAILFFKERVAQTNNTVLILGFILTVVLIRPDLDVKLGALIALLASIMHAIAGLLVKKISRTESVLTLMLSMVCIMTPISLIPSLYVWVHPNNLTVTLYLLLIAIFATIGNYLWTKALSMEKLTNLMPFEFSKLIFATLLGLFFFDEKLDYILIVSAVGLLILNNFLVKEIRSNEKF